MANEQEEHVPVLSVTVLNYNYAHYLPQCLDSILSQTFTDFELILINDRSTDNSLEVIQPYLADPRIRFINHEQNKGYIASLIEGSESSRGKYITVISADDFCVSDRAFEKLLEMMEADEEVAFAYSAFGEYAGNGSQIQVARRYTESFARSGIEEYCALIVDAWVLHSGVIIRSSAYKKVGGYNPSTRYACDTRMWLTLCVYGKVAYCTDELYAYRKHESNMSTSFSGIRGGLREHIQAIRTSYALMRKHPEVSEGLYIRAMKRNLSFPAVEFAFEGNVRAAWYAFWCALRLDPLLTILQTQTVVLIARTLLGSHGFQVMRSLARSALRRQAPHTSFA